MFLIKTDSMGCDGTLFTCPDTGTYVVDVVKEKGEFLVYPNPAKEKIHIKLNTKMPLETEIEILSINGSKLFEKQVYQTNEIKINNLHLEKGVYLVKIKTDKFVKTKKLIIN
jgi:hypothetical protein